MVLGAKARIKVGVAVAVLGLGGAALAIAVNGHDQATADQSVASSAKASDQTPSGEPSATVAAPGKSKAGQPSSGPVATKAPQTVINNEPPPGPEVNVTLCMLTRDRVTGLLGPDDGKESADQRIRNAVQSLEDSLETWRYVAQTEPAIRPLVTQTEKLAVAWRNVVKASDSGNKAAARTATGQADRLLAHLPATPPAGAVGCPA
jgi:hypothetical protein